MIEKIEAMNLCVCMDGLVWT